jgi:hypothetical protein
MSDNIVPLRPSQKHLPAIAVQLNEDGSVKTVANISEINKDPDAYETDIKAVFDGRFFMTMKTPAGGKIVWIIERYGIARPATPIEAKLWLENQAMTPEPEEMELQQVAQVLQAAMTGQPVDAIILGYASEICMRMSARTQGQRLPIFTEASIPEEPAVA